MSFNGYNNKLANVPTITGLSDIYADSVNTDTLIVDGNDVSDIIDQVPINTANIAALQQITTGQSYATVGDTTTFDNNVTLTTGKIMTADNFNGLASQSTTIEVTEHIIPSFTTYYLTFATDAGGAGQKNLLYDTIGFTNGLNYIPDTSTLSCVNFNGVASNAYLVRASNSNPMTAPIYYLPFVDGASAGYYDLNTTTNLSYDFSTNTLIAANFDGNATTATTATTAITASTASQVSITNTNTGTLYYPTFVDDFSTGNRSMRARSNLSYNLSTNGLSCSVLSALTSITPSNGSSISLNGTPVGNGGNVNTVCMGVNAGNATMPNNNFCFGTNAGRNLSTAGGFQSGVQNLCIGANSGNSLTYGKFNCFLGASAARFTTTGTNNTQIGAQTQSYPDNNFVGSYNTTIGSECHISVDGLSYSTAIGAGVVASTSNTVRIGRAADNTIFDGTVTLNNNLILDSVGYTLSPTELSYLDGVSSNIQTQFSGKVNNTGDETIGGIKTFSSVPICTTNATTSTQLTNKAYVDAAISASTPANMVTTNTTQSITGAKTFDGVTTTFQTNGSTATPTLNITDTGTSNRIAFFPRGGSGINNVAVVSDSMITAFSSAIDTGRLSIVPHSNTSCGIRLTNNTALIGAGGTAITPTASILFSGTNVGVTGTLTLNTDITLSKLNQMFSIKNNNLVNTTITTTGVVPAGGLNKIALTDGSNPTSAQILNTTVSGTNIPNQIDTYYVSAHSYNFSIQITTLGIPVGQINSINTLAIGTFITSNIGTNFVAGTYITGVAPGIDLYYISQNALNTTLFKINHTGSLITTNLTLSAATTPGTVLFKNDGAIQFLTNNASGNQIMPLSINSTEVDVNVPMVLSSLAIFNGIASFNGNVNIAQNNITLGSVTTVNLGSGAGSNQTNLVCGSTNAKSIAFITGNNTVLGGSAGNNLSVNSANNTLVGYSAGSSITSTGSNNVCVGKHAGAGTSSATQNTFVGNNTGFQTSGGTGNNNTCVGHSAGSSMTTTSTNNVCVGNNSGLGITTGIQNTFLGTTTGFQTVGGTGNNNTCVGFVAGDSMITTATQNTLIGSDSASALTSGTGNTVMGFGAAGALLTGQSNTIIGLQAGDLITGSFNTCIGSGSSVPNAANSNQIAIGTGTETMYIQGGFNYRVLNITATGGITFPFPQFFTLTLTAAVTLTLPTVSITHRGAVLKFKRNTGAFAVTFTTGGALVFKAFNSVGAFTATASLPAANFYTDFVCDGSGWYQLTRV